MSTDFLARILDQKRMEVEAARNELSEGDLREAALQRDGRRSLWKTLMAPGPRGANVIAEIKRASPSKGSIRTDLDAVQTARSYERGGAAAISVLTDRTFFQARPDDLGQVRSCVNLPVLRKDFIITPYQVYQAAVMKADAVLLIARALTRPELRDLLGVCGEMGLDALVEVHSERELDDATRAGARLIGINNRDLTTFETDLHTSVSIARHLASHQVAVSESGIRNRADILRLLDAGIWNFLIGESLVRSDNPERFLGELLGE